MVAILTSGGRTSITISRTVFRVDAGDDAGDDLLPENVIALFSDDAEEIVALIVA